MKEIGHQRYPRRRTNNVFCSKKIVLILFSNIVYNRYCNIIFQLYQLNLLKMWLGPQSWIIAMILSECSARRKHKCNQNLCTKLI